MRDRHVAVYGLHHADDLLLCETPFPHLLVSRFGEVQATPSNSTWTSFWGARHRIERILEERKGRAPLTEVLAELRRLESNEHIVYGALHVALQAENERLERIGKRRRFRTARDGEQRGWVSLESATDFVPGSIAQVLESRVLEANQRVDEQLRAHLQRMNWREFEDTFLTQVLEKLGFQDVQVTQPTRDGGVDARVTYKRGLVEARAIVSAKRWASKSTVGGDEVQRLRGIKGDEDTAIIITTARFSQDAKDEARPGQNQRAVYLIDSDRLVEICKQYEIGIRRHVLPSLLLVDEEEFDLEPEVGAEDDAEHDAVSATPSMLAVHRLRDEMLGDGERGINAAEIASLLGLRESTVRVYLGDAKRRAELGDRIRDDSILRERALRIVSERRRS